MRPTREFAHKCAEKDGNRRRLADVRFEGLAQSSVWGRSSKGLHAKYFSIEESGGQGRAYEETVPSHDEKEKTRALESAIYRGPVENRRV